MFVKRFFEETLAQTSYLIGCAATHEAIVIDPNRDIAQYLKAAEHEGARITHVTETHIHADFVSGSRELAAQTGATLHLSDEGDATWKYGFARDAGARLLTTGSRISVGNVQIDAVHTPGHTPEHLAFLVTDSAAANEPIAAATGDFVFVGDVGRPDLLERAAAIKGTMEASARTLYHSLLAFAARPDWLQIWPAHGAGSACGKSISDLPQSTLGYERRFNWAFRVRDEEEFVRRVLAGQPEPPTYFAEMKRVNRDGPPILGELRRPPALGLGALDAALGSGTVVVDTRPAAAYALGHIPGTINIPLTKSFTTWAGWLLPYTSDILLLADDGPASIDRAVRNLALIGLDRIAGVFGESTIDDWTAAGRAIGTIPQIRPADLRESIAHGGVSLIDVRGDNEWRAVRIPGARHIPLGYLTARLDEVPRHRPVVVHCAGGSRSSIAASLLRAHGVSQVVNLPGGIGEWQRAGLPVDSDEVGS